METGNSRAALDAAIDVYYDEIRTAMRRRGATPVQATEIVHDLYVKLSGNPQPLLAAGSIKAFLIRAAINLGIDRARRLAFERSLFAVLDASAEAVAHRPERAIETHLDMPRRIAFLRKTILELPPQCRNVFLAYRLMGVSKEEIAEVLGIKRRMIDRHLRKAMLHCLERMDQFDNG
jgi:RNA polymerase sigma-70 factor (ECF subfamily)